MSDSVVQAIQRWLFKTRMEFYGHFDLPWWFGAACLLYAVGGFTMLWTEPEWTRKSIFPYRSFAYFLIIIQAPLSFIADYCMHGKDSYWHLADRLVAIPAMTLEVSKLLVLWYAPNRRMSVVIAYGINSIVALFAFSQSRASQSSLDHDAFVIWHSLWHLYPLTTSTIVLVEFYLLGGWKFSVRRKGYRTDNNDGIRSREKKVHFL